MKKVSILALHLGYGGIEKSIVSLANSLCDCYDVKIISIYKLQEESAFKIDKRVNVQYLINSDIAERVKLYKELFFQIKWIELFKEVWKDYFKKLKILSFLKDTFYGLKVMLIDRKRKMIKAIKKNDADIIVSTRVMFNTWTGKYASKKCLKIAWEHNHHHGNMEYAASLVKSCKKMDTLVLVSESLRMFYKKQMKDANYKCKCVCIPNSLEFIPKKTSLLNSCHLISVGRFSREKGMPDLIDVFYKAYQKNHDLFLDLVGDGTQKNMIVDKIYEYGLEKHVKVHGYLTQDKIQKLLNKASIYLMTSYTESFGIVLLEAMSNGLPCIAYSSAEGACELIENGKDGFLIEDRDSDKMASRIIQLLEDDDARMELGKNAREKSLNYASASIKSKWLKVLKP